MVISDAGPLIALARINQLDLLPNLFGRICVTSLVADEVLSGSEFADTSTLVQAMNQPWLQTISLTDDQINACAYWVNLHQIDLGEASAMVLAQRQSEMPLLIMDDFRGRQAALHAKLALIGTTGLLLLAKRIGAISEVKPLLLRLRQQGYFLSQRLIDHAVQQAGESP